MVGRNVENANEIRADIKTRALLSRSSTDICIVYGSNSLFYSTLCRWVRKFSADVGPVISAPKSGRTKSSSSLRIVEKNKILVKSDARYTSTCLEFQKHLHCAFGEIF